MNQTQMSWLEGWRQGVAMIEAWGEDFLAVTPDSFHGERRDWPYVDGYLAAYHAAFGR